VLYDTKDHRAWLSNGLHTLLHLVRTSLREDQKGDFSDECLLNQSLLVEDLDQGDPRAAVRFLKNRHNLELPVFPALDEIRTEQTDGGGGGCKTTHHRTSTTVRLQDRVSQIMEALWQLIDHQATLDTGASGVPIRLPRSRLEGFRFMEVASRRQVTPRVVYLKAFGGAGKSWVDFVRAIRAVVLFGEGFGELICPTFLTDTETKATCERWGTLPKGKDYLAVSGHDLTRIVRQEGSSISSPVKLAPGIFWNQFQVTLDRCGCEGRTGKGKAPAGILRASSSLLHPPCDRVQVLLPPRSALIPRGTATSAKPIELDPDSAFIFGRSELFPWRWPDQGDPQQEDLGSLGSSCVTTTDTNTNTSVVSTTASATSKSPSSAGQSREGASITPPSSVVSVSSPQISQHQDSVGMPEGEGKEVTERRRSGRGRVKRIWEFIRSRGILFSRVRQ